MDLILLHVTKTMAILIDYLVAVIQPKSLTCTNLQNFFQAIAASYFSPNSRRHQVFRSYEN